MVKARQTRRLDPVCPIAYLNRAALMNATNKDSHNVIRELKKICLAANIIEAELKLEKSFNCAALVTLNRTDLAHPGNEADAGTEHLLAKSLAKFQTITFRAKLPTARAD